MYSKKSCLVLTLALFFASTGFCYAESEIVKQFRDELNAKNAAGMNALITKNKEKIPAELKALVDEALLPQTAKADMESKFFIAERIASEYRKVTGDMGVLKEAKRRMFESYLSMPLRPEPVNGAVTVEIKAGGAKGVFSPDNIIIKKGETIRWVNNDKDGHLLATAPVIGMDGILSPDIEPGKSWEQTFKLPGVYYYLCCLHKAVMYGKITVE